jgi:hypothetical protein
LSQYLGVLQRFVSSVGPWFVQGRTLGGLREAFAATFDSAETALEAGMQLSQPLRCDESALPIIAKDRSIPIYPAEVKASQRARLANWLPLHRQRGTHQGELKHLQPYFLPDRPLLHIVHQTGDGLAAVWHSLSSDGVYSTEIVTPSNWDFDGRSALWSRFWLIVNMPSGWVNAPQYDVASYWDNCAEGYDGIDQQEALDIIALAKGWKSAHSRLAGVLVNSGTYPIAPENMTVSVDGWTSLPVAGNWKSYVNSNGTRARNPYVTFLYEDNP